MNAFDQLRRRDRPVPPDDGFAARLLSRIAAELTSTVDLADRTERTTVTEIAATTTGTTATTDASGRRRGDVTVVPYLAVAGAARAVDWYTAVFDGREITRYTGDDGRIGHAELDLGGSSIYLSDEYPDVGAIAPATLGGTAVSLVVSVPDVDGVWARAVAAGADGTRPPADQPYGDRSATFVDPFGHRWMVQTPVASPTTAEIEAGFGGEFTVTSAVDAAPVDMTGPAEIGYVAIPVDDTERARGFYAALLGWVSEQGHHGPGHAHVGNTRLPIGFTPDGNDRPPVLYVRVGDVDAVAGRAVELGGEIVARSDGPSGANVECRDAQGGTFHLWQPAPGY